MGETFPADYDFYEVWARGANEDRPTRRYFGPSPHEAYRIVLKLASASGDDGVMGVAAFPPHAEHPPWRAGERIELSDVRGLPPSPEKRSIPDALS